MFALAFIISARKYRKTDHADERRKNDGDLLPT